VKIKGDDYRPPMFTQRGLPASSRCTLILKGGAKKKSWSPQKKHLRPQNIGRSVEKLGPPKGKEERAH